MDNYQSNRKLTVKVNDDASQIYDVNIGFPQGLVLGPLIFLLFLNYLSENITADAATLFADDTSLAISVE